MWSAKEVNDDGQWNYVSKGSESHTPSRTTTQGWVVWPHTKMDKFSRKCIFFGEVAKVGGGCFVQIPKGF